MLDVQSHGGIAGTGPRPTAGPGEPVTRLAAAIVLAAGGGTRMRSAVPKVLHRLAGRTLLGHAVHAAAALAPEHLVVVVGHGRDQVVEHLAELAAEIGRPVLPAVQDQQHGTGHAVGCALAALRAATGADPDGTVLVSYADTPLLDRAMLGRLLAEHTEAGNTATVLTAVLADPTGYGRIVRDRTGAVTGIVEQADADAEQQAITEINSGVLAFDAAALRTALAGLSADNAQQELYLTDTLAAVHTTGGRVGACGCPDPWLVTGINDRVELAAVGAELNRRLLRHWMREGVTVIDPATTWLDVQVRLAPDVTLLPGVQLYGATTVDAGARIGPDCTLTAMTIGEGATVIRTHGERSEIGAGASVGPFAYLRPGCSLGVKGKIGTFVETKNATIGAGSKVPHLTYAGDVTIGEHSNIGAASVFVNYDGVAKHHSTVGSHVRTGSDNMFIAPVSVGDGAYTAAGSVITDDVPPGAMAVARARQRNVEGWVARKRAGTAAAHAAEAAIKSKSTSQDENGAGHDGQENA
jgi:bifunctional UDP-N-acetylglucosamine pyrophosphorylase/glucosamine-1-phosphate N-acetyltransferase